MWFLWTNATRSIRRWMDESMNESINQSIRPTIDRSMKASWRPRVNAFLAKKAAKTQEKQAAKERAVQETIMA